MLTTCSIFLLILLCSPISSDEVDELDGSCPLNKDGDEDHPGCGKNIDENTSANFWNFDESGFSKDQLQKYLMEINRPMEYDLELEFIMDFLDTNKDRIVVQSELESAMELRPENVVHKTVESFNSFDADNDGYIILVEIESSVGKYITSEELVLIALDLDSHTDSKISIMEYIKTISRLGGKISESLTPFEKLTFLTSLEAKNVIQSSAKMFKETDDDEDGILEKEEFVNAIDKSPSPTGKVITEEQKMSIFKLLDKNEDNQISYSEFQTLLPPKPKDLNQALDETFKTADSDNDGFISRSEFEKHLAAQSSSVKVTPATEEEIERMFTDLDVDGDGLLSFEEMKKIVNEYKQAQTTKYALPQAFKELDKDQNGLLSKDEMENVVKMMEQRSGQKIKAETLIQMLDKNGDGEVDFEEMHALVKQFQSG